VLKQVGAAGGGVLLKSSTKNILKLYAIYCAIWSILYFSILGIQSFTSANFNATRASYLSTGIIAMVYYGGVLLKRLKRRRRKVARLDIIH
jgi:hypothetical protein